ncbi:MAG TPA: hypothetical protein PLU33_12950 [Treponemataceae bacterium]|nr:hypothetical protein [Treponemataceae bacterium]
MTFTWYPQFLDAEAAPKVKEFLDKELKKRPDLYQLTKDFLKKLKKVESLDEYYKTEIMEKLDGHLHEMKIPKKRPGGVVRIYFCYNPEDSLNLILLDAELKHKTKPERLDNAKKRLNQYQEYLNKGKKDEQRRK